jgi:Uma2 family endonuclease
MDWSVADVQRQLDGIPPEHIRTFPAPGTNTEAEMQRKVREYFKAGATRAWIVDPKSQTARIFMSPRRSTLVNEDGLLDVGNLLPGFELTLKEWFARAQRRSARRKKKK